MSIRVITAVLDLAPAVVTPSERLVLLALAWHADEHGRNAWPAVGTLRRKTSLGRRTIQIVLRKLEGKGLVYVQSVAARRSVRYGVDLKRLDCARYAQSGPDDCAPDAQSEPVSAAADCAPAAPHCAAAAPPLRSTCAPTAQHVRPIRPVTVLEPSQKKSLAAAPRMSAPDATHPNHEDDDDDDACADQNRADQNRVAIVGGKDWLEQGEAGRPLALLYDGYAPARILELVAHETFNALGDHASFDVLAEDFLTRIHGLDMDPDQDIGLILFSVKQERRARRSNGAGVPTVSRPCR